MTAVTILAELGGARRFSSSRDAVRYAGLDITVHQSARRRAGTPQPPGPTDAAPGAVRGRALRFREGSPDSDYYRRTAERLGGTGAGLAVARKLLKRSYHTLRQLGEEALAPA